MAGPAKHFLEFGAFRLDLGKRRLLRAGDVVPLTPKAFDTLLALIENGGRIVEKDDLMEKVWPGVAVEENNLTQNISALRKALGETRDDPQYILTVPGRGYRFLASVAEKWDEKPLESEKIFTLSLSESAVQMASGTGITQPPEQVAVEAGGIRPEEVGRRPLPKSMVISALAVLLAARGIAFWSLRHLKPGESAAAETAIA